MSSQQHTEKRRQPTTMHKGVFRYLALPEELQKIVLEKYFEDNDFNLTERASQSFVQRAIQVEATVTSRYNILNLLLVSKEFQSQVLAAMKYCRRGSYEIDGVSFGYGPLWYGRLLGFMEERSLLIDETITSALAMDRQTALRLQVIIRRFENIRWMNFEADCDDTSEKVMHNFIIEQDLTAILTSVMDEAIATQVNQDFRNFVSANGIDAEGVLQRGSVSWRSLTDIEHWLPRGDYSRFLLSGWKGLVIEVSISSAGATVVRKGIRHGAFLKQCSRTGSELTSILAWLEAVRCKDIDEARRIKETWTNFQESEMVF